MSQLFGQTITEDINTSSGSGATAYLLRQAANVVERVDAENEGTYELAAIAIGSDDLDAGLSLYFRKCALTSAERKEWVRRNG
jgi:hypothetical protein